MINQNAQEYEALRLKLECEDDADNWEERCKAAEAKQTVMIKELEVAIQSEQERTLA